MRSSTVCRTAVRYRARYLAQAISGSAPHRVPSIRRQLHGLWAVAAAADKLQDCVGWVISWAHVLQEDLPFEPVHRQTGGASHAHAAVGS
jgi:hypothetical protein